MTIIDCEREERAAATPREERMATRLLEMANVLADEGYTRTEIAETMIDLGATLGAVGDPVGFSARCLVIARALARRAEERVAANNIHSSPGGLQ